jgi:hypothetical protein
LLARSDAGNDGVAKQNAAVLPAKNSDAKVIDAKMADE